MHKPLIYQMIFWTQHRKPLYIRFGQNTEETVSTTHVLCPGIRNVHILQSALITRNPFLTSKQNYFHYKLRHVLFFYLTLNMLLKTFLLFPISFRISVHVVDFQSLISVICIVRFISINDRQLF